MKLWFFVRPSLTTFTIRVLLFLWFEAVFGLKINLAKSELVSVGNVDNVDGLVGILGYMVSSLPLKYLGRSMGASYKAKSIWDGVVEKIVLRLASWKKIYFSKGGRVTIIKIILSTFHMYLMTLFSITTSIANHIEKLHWDFL
jgi:hypothetical protein